MSSPVQIRLVGGDVEWAGRVEIHLQDNVIWGRVCDNGWSLASARVVCRQLGYEYAIGATIGTTFGTGKELIPSMHGVVNVHVQCTYIPG